MSTIAPTAAPPATGAARRSMNDWAMVIAIAAAAGLVASRLTALAIPLALAPVVLVALGKYRSATLWLVSLEMALGGWGHSFFIQGLPIRHLLLAVVLAAWAVVKLLHTDWRLRGGPHAATAALFLATIVVAIQVSLVNGNPDVWQDAATPFFLLLLFPFADVAARPRGPETLLRIFVGSVFVLGIVQCVLTLAIFVGALSGDWLYIVFRDRLLGGVSPIAGPFWRVFIVGSIYFQIVILILSAGLLAGRPLFGYARDLTMLAIIGAGLIFTYTRGFWATTIIGFGLLAALTTARGRVRWMVAGLAAVLALVLLIPMADAAVIEVLQRRIERTFDPDRDVSVALRLDLYPRVFARVLERPLFGYGFGLPVENQLYYENSYLYYAVKFGIVGLLILALGWIVLLWDGVRQARHHPDLAVRARAAGLTAAVVSMLIVTSINPFINSPVGFYFQALTAAVLYGYGLQAARSGSGRAPATGPQP